MKMKIRRRSDNNILYKFGFWKSLLVAGHKAKVTRYLCSSMHF